MDGWTHMSTHGEGGGGGKFVAGIKYVRQYAEFFIVFRTSYGRLLASLRSNALKRRRIDLNTIWLPWYYLIPFN